MAILNPFISNYMPCNRSAHLSSNPDLCSSQFCSFQSLYIVLKFLWLSCRSRGFPLPLLLSSSSSADSLTSMFFYLYCEGSLVVIIPSLLNPLFFYSITPLLV
ncbi:transmembrane protein, putative [Medicago truncatula]|uniref:Transmembrane protein, putative n=1 Tax=Medicago truncatula TaxID=3880 RepID=G7JXA9_MEDTR|nr:transmembrane protein, putative [Medicago truncatula]